MILLIDSYDSFSYNLYQLVGALNPDIQVIRNDEKTVAEIRAMAPSHILLSPGPGRPGGEDMALGDELARKTVEKVQALTQAPAEPVEVEGCDPIRPYYTPRDRHGEPIKDFLKAKPVTDPDKCVKCGLCARLCPMGSIDPDDVSKVTGKCIKCCACVKKCPKGAKYFDHEGYLYHQHELEDQYAGRRAPSKIFG